MHTRIALARCLRKNKRDLPGSPLDRSAGVLPPFRLNLRNADQVGVFRELHCEGTAAGHEVVGPRCLPRGESSRATRRLGASPTPIRPQHPVGGRSRQMTIPPQVHFCWIGTRLPWAYVFAVLSAAERSAMDRIILHHTDALEDGAELRSLMNAPRVQLSRIDPSAFLSQVGDQLGLGGRIAGLYGRLGSPVMRTDVLRAAILYRYGGVYLDLDTVTVASLLPLLDTAQFVGSELIVWPPIVRDSRAPAVWARHLSLDLLRKGLRMIPHGWQLFRRIERLYFRGLNNAAMGAEANAGLFWDYLHAMFAVPLERLTQAYALGPDLLGEVVHRYQRGDLTIQNPPVFYPLPPEISEHWFRIGRGVTLDTVLSAETRVVHWYGSISTKSRIARINPDYVREHRTRQLYSMLVCSCIPALSCPALP